MNRRATLTTLVGKKSDHFNRKMNKSAVVLGGLDAYSGPWEYEQAAHLLRRAMFGPSYQQIREAVTDGLATTVSKLLDLSKLPNTGPLNPGKIGRNTNINDIYVPTGQSWVYKENGEWKGKGYPQNDQAATQANQLYRRLSLRAWMIERILTEEVSIIEKMTLFWHNHFVTASTNEPLYEFAYIQTLRDNSLGNFRELTKKMTVDPAMLLYLNGNENTNAAPNENYARELFELFAIGKGPVAGPGDYTNYTEEDIRQAAKVLTGWSVPFRNIFQENIALTATFTQGRHDTSRKTFSHRFSNTTINSAGAEEYKQLVDMIFQQAECARYICRELYRWFLYYEIGPDTEQNIIEPLAQLLISNNYEMKPVIEALLKSQHFYDVLNIGPMIKNPIDFVFSSLKAFYYQEQLPAGIADRYTTLVGIGNLFTSMQMVYLDPPDVAGWKAYYQAPLFYRIWINATTLQARMAYTTQYALGITPQGLPFRNGFDVLKFTSRIQSPMDPISLIDEFVAILFPRPITDEQKDYLKEILLPGLPDYEWTIEYGDYLGNATNLLLRNAVESKLRNLLNAMLSMPEFYLS
jgi:uncharacterized protein (DUF1800 family)